MCIRDSAGSVRAYATRYGVAAGTNIAVFTNNDSGWQTAVELVSKGINVTAVIDPRDTAPRAHIPGVAMIMGASVCDTQGRKALNRITLTNGQVINVDCLAVSGGWSPNVHLTCHQRGRPFGTMKLLDLFQGVICLLVNQLRVHQMAR